MFENLLAVERAARCGSSKGRGVIRGLRESLSPWHPSADFELSTSRSLIEKEATSSYFPSTHRVRFQNVSTWITEEYSRWSTCNFPFKMCYRRSTSEKQWCVYFSLIVACICYCSACVFVCMFWDCIPAIVCSVSSRTVTTVIVVFRFPPWWSIVFAALEDSFHYTAVEN